MKGLLLALVGALLAKAVWIYVFWRPAKALQGPLLKKDLMARRAYLIEMALLPFSQIKQRQWLIPDLFQREWVLGTYSMTATALANLSFLYPETREENLQVVSRLVERALDPDAAQFDTAQWGKSALESLDEKSGHIAYLGQLNLILASYHYLGGADANYRKLFDRVSRAIEMKIKSSPIFAAETYPHEVYIGDNTAALASLQLHEKFTLRRRSQTVQDWIICAKKIWIDPRTGLLAHVLAEDGRPYFPARGMTAGWNTFFLPFMDDAFAAEQFKNLKTHLYDTRLGFISGIREYPHGLDLPGDVDSGPVLLGLSPSATGFSFAGACLYKDSHLLSRLAFTSELAGFTVQWRGQRRYLFSPLVGDAILLAMRTAVPWDK